MGEDLTDLQPGQPGHTDMGPDASRAPRSGYAGLTDTVVHDQEWGDPRAEAVPLRVIFLPQPRPRPAADRVPSIRAIGAQLHVGSPPRAQRLREHLPNFVGSGRRSVPMG